MALKTRFVRDAQNRVCGTIISGYPDGSEAVRNRQGQLIGRVLQHQKIDEGRIFMQKLGTPRDVVHTRTVAQEDFEKYGYSVVEE